LEAWAEEKAFKLENESINKDFKEIDKEIKSIEHPCFY